jgi:hypothetical protein
LNSGGTSLNFYLPIGSADKPLPENICLAHLPLFPFLTGARQHLILFGPIHPFEFYEYLSQKQPFFVLSGHFSRIKRQI